MPVRCSSTAAVAAATDGARDDWWREPETRMEFRRISEPVAVRDVIMVAADPHAFSEFFARLQGETAVDAGKDTLTVRFGPSRIVMLTPGGFAERFPGTAPTHARSTPGFAGFQVEAPEIGRLREQLHRRGADFREDGSSRRLWIDPERASGTLIEFVESPT